MFICLHMLRTLRLHQEVPPARGPSLTVAPKGLSVTEAMHTCFAQRALAHLAQAVSSIQIEEVRSVPAYIMSIIAKHQPGREVRLRSDSGGAPPVRRTGTSWTARRRYTLLWRTVTVTQSTLDHIPVGPGLRPTPMWMSMLPVSAPTPADGC